LAEDWITIIKNDNILMYFYTRFIRKYFGYVDSRVGLKVECLVERDLLMVLILMSSL